MGYRDPTVRVEFDELGDGCFVELKNPKLCRLDEITTAEVPNGDDGKPDTHALIREQSSMIAGLVRDWLVWDSDTGEELRVPKSRDDGELVERLPEVMVRGLREKIVEAFPT